MRPPKIRVLSDPDALALAVAKHVQLRVKQVELTEGEHLSLVLSGGSTPQGLYRLLASETFAEKIDWSQVEVFFGDERCVSPSDPGSNFGAARKAMLEWVPLREGATHRIRGELGPDRAAAEYEREIQDVLGPGIPRFGLVLLGLGSDGHTASLFPGAPTLEEREGIAVPARGPAPYRDRVTLTLSALDRAAEIAFLVSGSAKAEILARVMKERKSGHPSLPAARVNPTQGEVAWYIDEAAARKL